MELRDYQIILASNSPRRRELLKQVGVEFEVVVSEAEEEIRSDVPSEVVMQLSRDKALDVARRVPASSLVIGADTVVSFEGKILGKPKDREEAYDMIRSYAGRYHSVYTGVSLVYNGQVSSFFEETIVCVRDMSDAEIYEYIDLGECYDKAGAYGIQGYFARYVSRIEGDYFNVVGLPLCRTMYEIKRLQEAFYE